MDDNRKAVHDAHNLVIRHMLDVSEAMRNAESIADPQARQVVTEALGCMQDILSHCYHKLGSALDTIK